MPADGHFNAQPQNPAAFDFHAYYGRNDPIKHGHIHLTQNGTEYHRPPGTRLLGQTALGGAWPHLG